MSFGGWAVFAILLWAIAFFSFFAEEYGVWIVSGILAFIVSFVAATKRNDSESTTQTSTKSPIQSPIISESDLQNEFMKFSWRQMEELTGKLFEKKGYSVEVTQASGDFGIDVWASKNEEKIGIQVKHWNKDVGFDDVTKTLGSNLGKANKYILISTKSFFTNQAWDHQRQHSHLIELWDTNRFREELRENFIRNTDVETSSDDKIDSFDFDKGFNLDEVYDSKD